MISIEDAADSLIPEIFMEKEPGYDAWLEEKVTRTLDAVKTGKTNTSSHEDVMNRVWERIQAKARP